jgi:hypothetical protein
MLGHRRGFSREIAAPDRDRRRFERHLEAGHSADRLRGNVGSDDLSDVPRGT